MRVPFASHPKPIRSVSISPMWAVDLLCAGCKGPIPAIRPEAPEPGDEVAAMATASRVPYSFSPCRHTVCVECHSALELGMAAPACPACDNTLRALPKPKPRHAKRGRESMALVEEPGWLQLEAARTELCSTGKRKGRVGDDPVAVKEALLAAAAKTEALSTRIGDAAVALEADAIEAIDAARADLVAWMDRVFADAHKAAAALCASRVKKMEATRDELAVTAAQIRAMVSSGNLQLAHELASQGLSRVQDTAPYVFSRLSLRNQLAIAGSVCPKLAEIAKQTPYVGIILTPALPPHLAVIRDSPPLKVTVRVKDTGGAWVSRLEPEDVSVASLPAAGCTVHSISRGAEAGHVVVVFGLNLLPGVGGPTPVFVTFSVAEGTLERTTAISLVPREECVAVSQVGTVPSALPGQRCPTNAFAAGTGTLVHDTGTSWRVLDLDNSTAPQNVLPMRTHQILCAIDDRWAFAGKRWMTPGGHFVAGHVEPRMVYLPRVSEHVSPVCTTVHALLSAPGEPPIDCYLCPRPDVVACWCCVREEAPVPAAPNAVPALKHQFAVRFQTTLRDQVAMGSPVLWRPPVIPAVLAPHPGAFPRGGAVLVVPVNTGLVLLDPDIGCVLVDLPRQPATSVAVAPGGLSLVIHTDLGTVVLHHDLHTILQTFVIPSLMHVFNTAGGRCLGMCEDGNVLTFTEIGNKDTQIEGLVVLAG